MSYVRIHIDGEAGDVVASLPIARHLGGAEYFLNQGRNPRPFQVSAHMLLPLMTAQPYIYSAMWHNHPGAMITHELCTWRKQFYKPTQTLTRSMADSLGLGEIDMSPWLSNITPHPGMEGRVVVQRSARYQHKAFPWRQVAAKYKDALVFVGLPDEYRAFNHALGRTVEHKKIRDYLHFAEIIKGSKLFISNQTSGYWLAAGMGHPLVQEVEMTRKIHDSQVPRDNAIYYTGNAPLHLP